MDIRPQVLMVLTVGVVLPTLLCAVENGAAPPDLDAMQAQIAARLQQGDAVLAIPDANPAEALPHYLSAYALAEKLTAPDVTSTALNDSYNRLGELWLKLGNSAKALHCFRGALEGREKLRWRFPENTQFRLDLCSSQERLGDLYRKLGNTEKAGEHYRSGLSTFEELVELHPEDVDLRRNLAANYERLGGFYGELGATKNAKEGGIYWDEPEYDSHPEHAQAQGYYWMALAIREQLVKQEPRNLQLKHGVAGTFNLLGDLYGNRWRRQERVSRRKALAIAEELVKADPANPLGWSALMSTYNGMRVFAQPEDFAKPVEKGELDRKALSAAEQLVKLDPANRDGWECISLTSMNLGARLEESDDLVQAREFYLKILVASETLAKLVKESGDDYRLQVGAACERLGRLAEKQGEIPEAILRYEQVLDIWTKRFQEDPYTPWVRSGLEEAQATLYRLRTGRPPK